MNKKNNKFNEWVDSENDINIFNGYTIQGKAYDTDEKYTAWLKAIPKIGKALGFKLQERKHIIKNERFVNEEIIEYRVIRKDLLNRIKDKNDNDIK